MEVGIDRLERSGQVAWQVRIGRRRLTFHEELAARTFAAQLHQRISWLRQQARSAGSEEGRP